MPSPRLDHVIKLIIIIVITMNIIVINIIINITRVTPSVNGRF